MNIENYFISEDFLNSLMPLKRIFEKGDLSNNSDLIGYFIDISIKYSILLREKDKLYTMGLNEFVNNIADYVSKIDLKKSSDFKCDYDLKKYVCKLYIGALLKKINLPKESLQNEDLRLKLCIYIIQNLEGIEYKFHAFNSAVYDSIKEHGITPNFNFTAQQEIDFIDQIFKQYSINIFDWQKMNSEGKVSYSKTSSVSYYYGINSPEWFSLFTGQGSSFNSTNKYQKNAFIEGNYDAAKQNILNLMIEQCFSDKDIHIVLDFFDKNWTLYANKNPMLAIIPEDYNEEEVNKLIDFLFSNPNYKNSIEEILSFCLLNGDVDCQTSETINASNIIFVKLPKCSKIIEKLTELSQAGLNSQIDLSGKDGLIGDYGEQKHVK